MRFKSIIFVLFFLSNLSFAAPKRARDADETQNAANKKQQTVHQVPPGLFINACAEGNVAGVSFLFGQDPEVIRGEVDKKTALIAAAESGHLEVVKFLLENQATINQANQKGSTALMFAAENGHLAVVKLLLENQATTDQVNHNGFTALMYAASRGHLEIVKFLLENQAYIDQVDAREGSTALMYAAQSGHLEVVKLLLEYEANVDKPNKIGRTALVHAAYSGHLEVVKLLLEHQPAVDTSYALMVAIHKGHTEVVKFFLENGMDVNRKNIAGESPLSLAAKQGSEELIETLFAYSSKPNLQTVMHATTEARKNVSRYWAAQRIDELYSQCKREAIIESIQVPATVADIIERYTR